MGKNNRKGKIRVILGFAFILVLVSQGFPGEKKLRVVTECADVFLKPDTQSLVVETLKQGDILTLSSSRKFRNLFNYVYFNSTESGCVKSGYVLESTVEKLFQVTKSVVLISGETQETSLLLENSIGLLPDNGWGMRTMDVIAGFGPPLVEEQAFGRDVLMYKKPFMGLDCSIVYTFFEGKLDQVKYTFKGDFQDLNRHITEYDRIRKTLVREYGNTVDDHVVWHNEQLKSSAVYWGRAVSMGHLEYSSRWAVSDSEIQLLLTGKNQSVTLQIKCLKQQTSFGGGEGDIDSLSQSATRR